MKAPAATALLRLGIVDDDFAKPRSGAFGGGCMFAALLNSARATLSVVMTIA